MVLQLHDSKFPRDVGAPDIVIIPLNVSNVTITVNHKLRSS